MPIEVSCPDHGGIFIIQKPCCMVLYEHLEPSFCPGVVAVIVYVEDHGFAIVTFELYRYYVVHAWNVNILPTLCFESFADPDHRSYCVVPTSIFWEDWPEVRWRRDDIEVVDVRFLYQYDIPVVTFDVVEQVFMCDLGFVQIDLQKAKGWLGGLGLLRWLLGVLR